MKAIAVTPALKRQSVALPCGDGLARNHLRMLSRQGGHFIVLRLLIMASASPSSKGYVPLLGDGIVGDPRVGDVGVGEIGRCMPDKVVTDGL